METLAYGLLRGLLVFLLVAGGGGVGTVWAESGIRIKSGPTMLEATNPPCNAARTTTYEVTLENTNCVCNEDVNPIRQANVVDLVRTQARPNGSFEFLGFMKTLGDEPSPTITFIDMEDESSATFFFQARTGPVACGIRGGGDFEEAEFGIVICDSGGGCDWGLWIDPPDPVCESPKHLLVIRLQADMTLCPASETGAAPYSRNGQGQWWAACGARPR